MSSSDQPILKDRYFLLTCSIIFLGWAIVQTFILYWYGIEMTTAIKDAVLTATTITLACYVVANALHYYQPGKERVVYILVWVFSLSILSLTGSYYGVRWLIEDEVYREFVKYSIPLRFVAAGLLIGWMAVMNLLWNIQKNTSENERRKLDAASLAREAELYNLRQQLQPHFIFNSLNSIIALISSSPEKARQMVFQLSDFLRGTLQKDDEALLNINEELEHLQLYLDIEKVRFGHRLNLQLRIVDYCEDCLLPAMIIQPLLENAIKYGVYNTTGKVDILIEVRKVTDFLGIQISNPFDPDHQVSQKSSGFGLRSIERRLFLIYGRTDLLKIEQRDNKFIATLLIPQ